ncbi:hypothetical protein DRO61_08980 [Candidatus Bathyarchaeota archaeon]|jgi:hypothetical protein|nr:MAG: hypothetical protein DRO61_08980 [Candidatus Bathyarchaeota archaeon]
MYSIRICQVIIEGKMMKEKSVELIYLLQVQQIELNEKLMEKWSEVGDLISEILEINGKILGILKEESKGEQTKKEGA